MENPPCLVIAFDFGVFGHDPRVTGRTGFCMDCILGFASGYNWHCQLEQRQGFFICYSSSDNEVVQLGLSRCMERTPGDIGNAR